MPVVRLIPRWRLPPRPGRREFTGQVGLLRGRFKEVEVCAIGKFSHLRNRQPLVNCPPSRRQRRLCRLPVRELLAGWLLGVSLFVPPADAVAVEPVRPQATAGVRELEPELYYLEDDAGGLVPVPGFRYRDFVDLIRLREGLPGIPELPGAVLEQVRVRVIMPPRDDNQQTAVAEVEAVIRQTRPGWVMLPLKLPELVLTAPPRVTGAGRVILTVDRSPVAVNADTADQRLPTVADGLVTFRGESGGFLAWVNGRDTGTPVSESDSERQTITLEGLIPVDGTDRRDLISLTLPAAARSRLEIDSWRRKPEVSLAPRVLAPAVVPLGDGPEAASGSRVSVEGLVGLTRIRLTNPEPATPMAAELTEVTTESVVRVDGRTARIDAVLQLANLPANRRTLTIALPPRAVLRRVGQPASLVRLGGTPEQPVVVVRLDDVREGKAMVELACERAIDPAGRKNFDVGGFSVADIPDWRQWGSTSVIAEGDWQVDWEPQPENRRIDPPVAMQQPGFVAAFAYDSQPARLPLTVKPRRSRVVIEPEYRYHVSGSRIEVDIRLRASIRGVAAERVRLAIPGWEVEEVGPAGIVDTARVAVDEEEVSVPFLQPLAGDVVVELRCSRPIDRVNTLLRWTTPVPRADLVGPASVTITSDSDIEVIPDNELIEGMSRQVAAQQGKVVGEAPRMAYRVEATEAIFAANRRFLDRQVDATVASQIDIGTTALAVRQVVRLDVANVPLEFIEWAVPEFVLDEADIEIRQKGQLLLPDIVAADIAAEPVSDPTEPAAPAAVPEAGDDGATSTSPQRVIRALLTEPLLGMGELVIRYRQPLPKIPDETTVAVSVPLLLPQPAVIGRESVTLTETVGFNVDVRDDRWNREGDLQQQGFGRTWNAVQQQPRIDLAISRRGEDVRGETVVEAAWVQTTIRQTLRIDHWTCAVTTAAGRLPLFLPVAKELASEANANTQTTARVRVDGGEWQAADDASGRLLVDLDRTGGTHLLEIEIRQPRANRPTIGWLSLPNRVALEQSGLPASTLYRRVYWELLTPPDAVVLAGPAGWTGQQAWGWTSLGFRPTPVVSAKELAAWVTTAAERKPAGSGLAGDAGSGVLAEQLEALVAAPAAAVNTRLLYCDVGAPAAASIMLMPQWLLVLVASGLPLLVGLAVSLQGRLLRQFAGLLAVAFIAGMALVPLATLTVLQAAVPGFVLASIAGVSVWWRTARPLGTRLPVDVVSGYDRRPDSVTRAAPDDSLVINTKPASAQSAPDVVPQRSVAE